MQGNLKMPRGGKLASNGKNLYIWMQTQKENYRKGRLSNEKRQRLEKIGVIWKSEFDLRWDAMLPYAEEYFRQNGTLYVPQSYKTDDGHALGAWISAQRQNHKRGILSADRIQRLENIGMIWNERDAKWMEALNFAKAFHDQNGHWSVPSDLKTASGVVIKSWISTQRNQYKNGTLSGDRIKKLNEIGFVWNGNKHRVQRRYDQSN